MQKYIYMYLNGTGKAKNLKKEKCPLKQELKLKYHSLLRTQYYIINIRMI